MEEAAAHTKIRTIIDSTVKTILFFYFAFTWCCAAAQDTTGTIVHKDPRIDQLVRKAIEINEFNTRDARRYVQGFRILVISTNDRNKANDAKALLYRYFPEMNAYMVYQSPYFKLKAGNFKTSRDAEEALSRLKMHFTNEIYVIRDVIEINPDKSAELEK